MFFVVVCLKQRYDENRPTLPQLYRTGVFQAGLPHFSSSMYLHARANGTELVLFDWMTYYRQAFESSFLEEEEREYKQLDVSIAQYFRRFDDSMDIRKNVCRWPAEKFIRPIICDLIVPLGFDSRESRHNQLRDICNITKYW